MNLDSVKVSSKTKFNLNQLANDLCNKELQTGQTQKMSVNTAGGYIFTWNTHTKDFDIVEGCTTQGIKTISEG